MAKHPETRPGEIFLSNIESQYFATSTYRTKRLGVTAYDINGKPVAGLYPMFVQASELEKNPSLVDRIDSDNACLKGH